MILHGLYGMKQRCLIIAAFAFPWITLSVSPPIANFLVTNIDVQPSTTEDGDNVVEFHARSPASKTTAVVLENVRDTGRKYRKGIRRYPIFSGRLITPGSVERRVVQNKGKPSTARSKTTLLCLHGFNTQPSTWLKRCASYCGDFTVIPVIWPASDKPAFWRAYRDDRSNAQATGEAFQPLLDCLGKINGRKCLMCHSMGNYILKWSAPKSTLKHRFEDIFMVAPDVDRDLFQTQEAGKRILNMVKNRVHVLHSNLDLALWARQTVTIRRPALGFYGPNEGDPVESLNSNAFARSGGLIGHSYFFSKEAIAYYESSLE